MENSGQSHWIPLSDLMTGLMMVFLLISVALMWRTVEMARISTSIVTDYENTKSDLMQALQEEFKEDVKRWNAEILGDMTVRFKEPEVLFDVGSAQLKDRFKIILTDFMPRYVKILTSTKYRDAIKEVRIEGHTSLFWEAAQTPLEAYFRNMELSQARTRSALEFMLGLNNVQDEAKWLRRHVTANGLSSSRPVLVNGQRDDAYSQRVEFRIVTNAEDRIAEIEGRIAEFAAKNY
jgi:outer membrane protein OmpA-like peptidoglycan-associated protein